MTDITKLAQREKFEAWWEREYKHLESSKYTDAVPHIKYGFWMAYQAGGAELVEALENANRYIERLREWNAGLAQESCERQQLISELEPIRAAAEKLVRCKGRYHSEQNYRALAALFGVKTPDLPPLEHENVHYADAAEMEIAALRQRIAELESRTVKLPDGWQFEECEIEGCENGAIFSVGTGSRNIHLCDKCAHEPQNSRLKKSPLSKRLPFKMSAGIKVEAE
ncbi:TPA: hypothetical protein MEW52_001246 [Klebsiella pneumoniae]|nr:hypothetical protein [Klebsiella pneumoniae]